MKRLWLLTVGVILAGAFLVATAQQPATPDVQANPASKNKASSPAPTASATNQGQKTSIGKGVLIITTAQPDAFWDEQVDVTGKGQAVITDFLYDATRGVVYAYREDDVTCKNGQTARAGILDAVYTEGNKAGKPAGSGWYAVGVNAGKCGAKKDMIYGCKLDASGNPTACGVATINNQTGEVDVATAQ